MNLEYSTMFNYAIRIDDIVSITGPSGTKIT